MIYVKKKQINFRYLREMVIVFKEGLMGRILHAYNRSIFYFSPSFLIVTFSFENGYDGTDLGTNGRYYEFYD